MKDRLRGGTGRKRKKRYIFLRHFSFPSFRFAGKTSGVRIILLAEKRAIRGSVWETQIKECGFPASFSVFF